MRKLIEKYEQAIIDIINPDGFTSWEELGFYDPPDEYTSISEYLWAELELDERAQVELSIYHEVIEDLKKLMEESI